MSLRLLRPLLTAAALFVCAPLAAAAQQQRPSPAQAEELLRNRPDLAAQLQQRIRSSGLTPDQIRSRLRAEGYSTSMLDEYLGGGGGAGGARRGASRASNSELLQAMEILGLADEDELTMMRRVTGSDTLEAGFEGDSLRRRRPPRAPRTGARDFLLDTLPIDTLRRRNPARIPDSSLVTPADSFRARRWEDPADARRDSLERENRLRLERMARDSGLAIFGLDLFSNGTSLFDANQAGPVDRNYRLGAGDRLLLLLTGDVEQSYPLTVTREGFIVIPQVGQLFVANLTLAELDNLLYSRLGRVYSGVRRGGGTTRFSVSVVQLRSFQVFVTGDVERPGSYRVSSAGTALTALYAAGGPTENGSLRRVEVRRGGRIVGALDVYDYLVRGDASNDVRLESGDVVFVPPRLARVRALGEVLRPATYELKPGETLADLMRTAGGLTALAAPRRIQVERVVPPAERTATGRDRLVVDVAAEQAAPAVPLVNGDVVRVSRIAERVRNRLTVVGNVWRPGEIGWEPGLRLSQALRNAGGIKPDTYLGRVLVARLQSDSTRVQLRAMLRDSTGAVMEDLELREDDEIQVFSATDFRPERYVAIAGAVRNGGRFQWREGMTVRDLTLLAGGLVEGALVTEAEVARLPQNRTGGVTATTVRVPIDSSYVGEDPRPRAGSAPETPLQPYDQVLIFRQPSFQLQRSVWLGGEVRYPGRYTLTTRSERLSDLIARAGGPTAEADANGVEFYRADRRQGRIGVDLRRVLRDARSRDNLPLLDGDSILIVPRVPLVIVEGEVNAPTSVPYQPGANLDYYVQAAGGRGARADLGRVYVVQPNGKVEAVRRRRFVPDAVPDPLPGSRVHVPARPENISGADASQLVTAAVQIVGAITSIIVAAVAIRR
ncbi:SLBB domain-containing protein [Roseisolibacter sp. H3M3-2]|uniref:SLBB domain-containing protein n=1 Tax=Roseisolibacter sp. H3M3-2 TaxID=3031323 RepID=UPI0023DB0BAF|nr:SLBB domain-containing protein [Roseisolibacter sp. H3M3-2]MDF1503779.1 SLBB domain-containing protein [Roseisolibacter sp. H3M3-2]